MDKKQAYDYFLGGLSKKLVALEHKIDEVEIGSPQYTKLMLEHTRIQGLLAALDDIANTV